MSALKKGDHLYLVDGSGYLFRAYHALPPLTRKSDGLPVGAVSGYCNMLWKLLEDMKGGDVPTHLAVIFDAGEKTFRNDLYDQYKAHRPPPPEDLVPQFPLIRDAVRAFSVPCIEELGLEADDIIACYAEAALAAGWQVTIVSSDKDLMQLVGPQVRFYDFESGAKGKPGYRPERNLDVETSDSPSRDGLRVPDESACPRRCGGCCRTRWQSRARAIASAWSLL